MRKKRSPIHVDVYRSDQWSCASWCHKNGIRIYHLPKSKDTDGFYIEVYSNGTTTPSIRYDTLQQASYKIWELYCHIHDKYNK